ncbi:sensor histidine kinase [Idiomarina sp. OXR-189]|uniref:sensor histidine kinase n=1 Tax=Idiomarina sp. OXR-189 TaxID=3100175 RepID=UPI002AC9243B|nr:ATP-binding protein [Idiomarina sp. OXR-189]WPZ01482.1 ATP-binding protein [Idiomarina sp. OXR-189]
MITLLTYKLVSKQHWAVFVALVIDIALGNLWVAYNGGISNPFTSLLLIFIVIAFLLLPTALAVATLCISILGQVSQLELPSLLQAKAIELPHAMHPEMLQHAQGMLIGFVIAAMIIALSMYYLKRQWLQSEKAFQAMRERQLRDEQLLTIGAAAAQLTHDVATPVQSLRLLNEELQETNVDIELKRDFSEYLRQVELSLTQWREAADDVRSKRQRLYTAGEMSVQLQQLLRVVKPDAQLHWELPESLRYCSVKADRTLFPAIANLIMNAIEASMRNGQAETEITFGDSTLEGQQQLVIQILDKGAGIHTSNQEKLGMSLSKSDTGMGVAAVISHATIERLNGKVSWQSNGNGTMTQVRLPIVDND